MLREGKLKLGENLEIRAPCGLDRLGDGTGRSDLSSKAFVHLHQKYEVEPQVELFNDGMGCDLTRARPKAANTGLARVNHDHEPHELCVSLLVYYDDQSRSQEPR